MRSPLLTLLGAALFAVPAPAQDDPKAVIQKAITASGGAEKLDKFKASRSTVKGHVTIQGMQVGVTGELLTQYPDQAKATFTLDLAGNKIPVTQVINGDTVSMSVAGMKQPLGEPENAELKESAYASSLQQLTPLVNGPAFQLKSLGESQSQGKAVVGVQVSHAKHKDVKLFFDKESGLLTKLERTARGETGKDVKEEQVLGDYKDFSGLKIPTREVTFKDGKQDSEITTTDYKPLDQIDPKEFGGG
jgi:hypothetical protein